MSTNARKIIGTIVFICGIGVAGFSGYQLFQGHDLMVSLSLAGGFIFGVALIFAGIAVATGASIRDILETMILGS